MMLPVEFYKTFWDSIGKLLVECFNPLQRVKQVHHKDKLYNTHWKKKDQDCCDLKNWRPISLLNIYAKTASKVIAERMKQLLPELIHDNQSGYIQGRWIGENILSIHNIVQYTQAKKLPGPLLPCRLLAQRPKPEDAP